MIYPGDTDILERLNAQENKQGYLKKLIPDDIARGWLEQRELAKCTYKYTLGKAS